MVELNKNNNLKLNKKTETVRRSVKIGRNDICPCGSERKYKKCCLQVKAEQPKEHYQQQLNELSPFKPEHREKRYNIAIEAIKDYPLDIDFNMIIATYSLANQNYPIAEEYLSRVWRILGTELENDYIEALIGLLIDSGKSEMAAEVMAAAEEELEETANFLLLKAELKSQQNQSKEALELIEKAYSLAPDNAVIIDVKIGILLGQERFKDAFEFWADNFAKLDYEQQGNYSYLLETVIDTFNLTSDTELEVIESYLHRFIEMFDLSDELDQILLSGNWEQADGLLEVIKNDISADSKLVLPFLNQLSLAGKYEEVAEYATSIEEHHRDNIDFNYLLAEVYYNLAELETAADYLDQALQLAKVKEDFEDWDLVADYLKVLLELGNDELGQLVTEIEELIGEEEDLLVTLLKVLDKGVFAASKLAFLSKLKELDLANINSTELILAELYQTICNCEQLNYLNELTNFEESFQELIEDIGEIGAYELAEQDRLKEVISQARKEELNSLLVDYAQLILDYEDQESAGFQAGLEQVITREVNHPYELLIKYRALLKAEQAEQILEEEAELISEQTLENYQFMAYVKSGNLDQAIGIMLQKLREGEEGFIKLFFLQGILKAAEVEEFMEEVNLTPEVINERL
ncbi:SEC-C metal-binding domain-containing protein [Fuchsiella alkaliacetigena]|uniref:SEC-C metal-binding domain-containing protein n=1 Tax=Fuchsiella alkaliacetigena TaxID=957042 RepID=UPI00200A2FA3|nr:SEC-C metal-binding domain-containing protein [Fuchsiella alkaliacetigena]MCK8825125.1 SEC-C domain-containing protein [Fuchsiella alkaliacetigena]